MKSLIEYVTEAVQKNLSNFQKGLLASITQAATSDQAYQLAIGSQNSVSALHQLQMMGFVTVNGKNVGLTSTGRQAALQNNLIDNMGKITEEGKNQLDEFVRNKQEFINAS